jgi:CheY-like chemotaxis protein/nitrogen-specific signal transduction histidine kinase
VESYDWKTERVTLPDGRHGVVCHFYDLSERQRYEAALRDADRQKDEFLAMLAHELRNPLAPIRTAAGVLRTRGPVDPLVVTCGDTIDRQTTLMARLLDDLLDVSRLSRGKLTLQRAPVLVDDILKAAAETSRPLLDQQGQILDMTLVDQRLLLDGDAARLTQVFANLLNNAAKFSSPGARIEVVVQRERDRAVVRVRDAGIGIAAEMLERVFELFTQADHQADHGPGGLGIGLSLARRLVELHGGTITATSAGIGRGSEFIVSLPVATSDARVERVVADQAKMSAIGRRRVLVIDDNIDAADMTALLLTGLGCDVQTAYDGETGSRAAESFRPDIVLLDLGLPDIDGHQVSRRIRDSAWGRTTRLIAVSGWGREEDRQRSKDAGFDGHLTKPVEPEALIQLIRDAPGTA